jgi:hypothetical protein
VSVPRLNGTAPRATVAALPPLDPPALNAGSTGFLTAPYAALFDVTPNASSCMLVLPTTTAPASRSTLTMPASISGTYSASNGLPAVVGSPATSMLSLTANGTPPRSPATASGGVSTTEM